jgi:sec-independent protein translocase protein TatA
MKDGGTKPEDGAAPVAGQVTASTPAQAEKTTIDVEAKTKS